VSVTVGSVGVTDAQMLVISVAVCKYVKVAVSVEYLYLWSNCTAASIERR